MRYPNKLYIEFRKKPHNMMKGISAGQVNFIKNFRMTKINISRKENDKRSGIDYKCTKLKDYSTIIELEMTRCDKL